MQNLVTLYNDFARSRLADISVLRFKVTVTCVKVTVTCSFYQEEIEFIPCGGVLVSAAVLPSRPGAGEIEQPGHGDDEPQNPPGDRHGHEHFGPLAAVEIEV